MQEDNFKHAYRINCNDKISSEESLRRSFYAIERNPILGYIKLTFSKEKRKLTDSEYLRLSGDHPFVLFRFMGDFISVSDVSIRIGSIDSWDNADTVVAVLTSLPILDR